MENKSSFLKDAIESITTLANKAKEPKTLEYNSHLYLIDEGGNANRIWEPKDTPQRKRVCSLDALVALIKHKAVDRYATNAHPLFVNCESFGSVTCYLSPDSGNYENLVTLYEAAATDVPGFLTLTLNGPSGSITLLDREEVHTAGNMFDFVAADDSGSPLSVGAYTVSGELIDQFGEATGSVSGQLTIGIPLAQQTDDEKEEGPASAKGNASA